jgi:uncharacterized protein
MGGGRLEPGIVAETGQRPWPIPNMPWVMAQTWQDVLFAHWSLPPASLASLVPAGLTLETFEGSAWLAVTPLRITGLRLRGLPALPGLSAFAEINCRTYVTVAGKPGVFFVSLDAESALAVAAARALYHLPYFRARFSVGTVNGRIHYASRRRQGRANAVEFRAEYTAAQAGWGPSTLARWLTERYCLYAVDGQRRLYRAEIDHAPWPLQAARATIFQNTVAAPLGLDLSAPPTLLHYAPRLDVRVWPPDLVPT